MNYLSHKTESKIIFFNTYTANNAEALYFYIVLWTDLQY